ncbi:hypothetical protein ABKA04_002840 [Annulohypoxylon sp. FPYF3050]
MDPFTAIGLVGNIIAFLDFGYKLVSATKDIHASASGSSAYNEDLSHSTQQLQQLVANLKVAKPLESLSDQEQSLLRVASDCKGVSEELANLLDKLKAQNPKSMRKAFRAAVRNWRKKDEKAELELKLDRCKQQLNLELVNILRSESRERLDKLLARGQASEYELQSLIKNVESLRSGTNVTCLGSEALDQIRSLLQLTDDAILNVRQTRVLDALRFEHMNERFEDIGEIHRKTFSWIFAGESDTASTSEISPHSIDGDDDEDQFWHRGSEASSVVSSIGSSIEYMDSSSSESDDDIIRNSNSVPTAENDLIDNSSFEWVLDDLSSIESDGDPEVPEVSDSRSSHSEVSSRQQQRETSPAFSDIDVPTSAFEKLISASKSHGEHKIALLLDGLDEFEGDHPALIRQLLAWCDENPNVKICVSSREWAIFGDAFGSFPKLRLHDLTSFDIRLFVRDRFREMHFDILEDSEDFFASNISKINNLEEAIVNESEGVFLWVSIVLRHIEDGDLEPMFQQLLESIPRNNRRLAYSMLSLVRCRRPWLPNFWNPPLMQFSFLEEYTEDKNFALKSTVDLLTTKEKNERVERTRRRIYGLCKGLLEIRQSEALTDLSTVLGSVVRLTHRSILEFLESQYFMQKLDLVLPGFDPYDAYCHTYLGLLQSVRFPASYYASKTSSIYEILAIAEDGTYSKAIVFDYSSYLSLRHDIDSMIQRCISTGQRASSRFHQFLDATHETLTSLKMDSEQYRCKLVVRHSDVAVCCDPKDLVMIACAQAGLYEYLSLKQNISPELMSCCASVVLLSLRFRGPRHPELWHPALKTIEALFNHGISPDSSIIPDRESAFHMMLQGWCYLSEPHLAAVAFMLYHGANPRFSLMISKTNYKFPRDINRTIFKLYFTSEHFPLDPEQGMQTRRILRYRARHYAIEASPTVLETIERHGHVIDLRTLVSFWFPNQSAILQEVIDWILALGCPIEAHHRAELQNRFGPALRPFFDPDHPDFVVYDHKPDWKLSFPGYCDKLVFGSHPAIFDRHAVFLIRRARFSWIERGVEEPDTWGYEQDAPSTTL